jgi:pectinesterase
MICVHASPSTFTHSFAVKAPLAPAIVGTEFKRVWATMSPLDSLSCAAVCGFLLPLAACSGGGKTGGAMDGGAETAAGAVAGDASDASAMVGSAADSGVFVDAAVGATTGPQAGPYSTACAVARPLLTPAQAAAETTLGYLAQAGIIGNGLVTDNWDPTPGLGDASAFTPTFTVAATGGTHTTVQSAVDAAVAHAQDAGMSRVYILVSAGTYNEVVCVPPSAPPITIYGASTDASQTTIAYGNYNGEAKAVGTPANSCTPNASATTFGTAGSATFSAFAAGFQAKNITISNDVTATTLGSTAGTQAVALITEADKVVLDNVRILGHQDTLYLETPGGGEVVRTYIKDSYIAGDVDFIFGGATAVLDTCQIQFVSDRKANGQVLSPSTDVHNAYGMLVTSGNFTADNAAISGVVGLGRAWDRSCTDVPTYVSACVAGGDYPNGQAVVRDSMLGAQIAAAPWLAAATTKRPFCDEPWECVIRDAGVDGVCPANRLFEYNNTGAGSAP